VKLQQCFPNNNKEKKRKKKGLQRELESCEAITSEGASERDELCCGCVALYYYINYTIALQYILIAVNVQNNEIIN